VNLIVAAMLLVIGGTVGACVGWSIRPRVSVRLFRWCRDCGAHIGIQCIECRDRQRAVNLRSGRLRADTLHADSQLRASAPRQRHDVLSGAG
jgi:hypothetical protein